MKFKNGATGMLLVDSDGGKSYATMKLDPPPERGKTQVDYLGKRYIWLGEVNSAGFLVLVETKA